MIEQARNQFNNAPGVFLQTLQAKKLQFALARSDIAAFIGYAQKGPCDLPLRVNSWRQFLSIYGQPLADTHLAVAVKGFFENGGVACYILRITDSEGAAAIAQISSQDSGSTNFFSIQAAFNVGALSLQNNQTDAVPDSAALQYFTQAQANQSMENKGFWGNNIAVSIVPRSLLSTDVIAISDDGTETFHGSLVGLEKDSLVRISQRKVHASGTVEDLSFIIAIKSFNPFSQSIEWQTPISDISYDFDLKQLLKIESIEFDVQVEYENRVVENFEGLSPNPAHSRSMYKIIKRESNYISLSLSNPANDDYSNPSTWPARTDRQALHLGKDGLLQIADIHYLDALSQLSKVDEVSTLCAPDLVLGNSNRLEQAFVADIQKIDCADLAPKKLGAIKGYVSDRSSNPEQALKGVLVIELGSGQQTTTQVDGGFEFSDLDFDLRTLRLSKPGFESAEIQVPALTEIQASSQPYNLNIAPLNQPRALNSLEVLNVQKAMLNPAIIGQYKIALLDSPHHNTKIEEIREWRAQLGGADTGALAYPWLQVPNPSTLDGEARLVPPCGHFAGLLAQSDLQTGPYKSCANIRMRYAKGLTQSLNKTQLALFTPEGITAIEARAGQGIRIYGSRTLSSEAQWRYLPVRRLFFAVEKSLEIALQWTVFESNTTILRQAVVQACTAFLARLWRQGAFAGSKQDEAFIVKCDLDNNPQAVRDDGRLIVDIAIAPSVPFEYINVRIGLTLDALEVTDS